MPISEEIIRLAGEGDRSAFEQIVLEYQKKIYSTVLRMCGNADDAFDLTQEVFIRVYNSLSGFRGQSSFTTWLYRICANICIDYGRKKSRQPLSMTIDSDDTEENTEYAVPDESFSPERIFEQKEIRRAVEEGLLQLSPEHRQILVLREIDQLSYEEIAAVLHIEIGTVRSRISRARMQLREILQKSGNLSGIVPSNDSKNDTRR